MRLQTKVLLSLSLFAVGSGLSGCSGFERKMHMAAARLESHPAYEGRLISAKKVGAMVALQFADGQLFDVQKAPASLMAGDIIRLYKTDKGYDAYLWGQASTRS